MRILTADNLGNITGELEPGKVFRLVSVEEINGEHSLEIETAHHLDKQTYVLFRDKWGKWREYVILGIRESHEDSELVVNTYYAVWSAQYELMGTVLKSQPGKNSPVNATAALTAALAGSRWSVGTVQRSTTGGASFYYLSGWQALAEVVKVWGGEVDATITVGESAITSRAIDLLGHIGDISTAHKLFEFGYNIESIARTMEDIPFYCRVIPRGQAEESDSGGYGRKIGITSVNPTGLEYIEDAETVDLVKTPDGLGGYIYPTVVVDYPEITDPQELYNIALADLHNYTRPRVTYEAEVLDFADAGLSEELELGDTVQVMDPELPASLRERVIRMEIDHLEPRNNRATIGYPAAGFSDQFESMQSSIDGLGQWRDLLQGALAADDTGNVVTTNDLTVKGDLTVSGDVAGNLEATGRISAAGLTSEAANLQLNSTNITSGQATNANGNAYIALNDSTGVQMGRIDAIVNNGFDRARWYLRREVNGSAVYNGINLGLDASGNPNVTLMGGAAAWLAALGLTTTTTTTVANIAAASSNFAISSARYAVNGKVASVDLIMTTTNALGTNAMYTICTLVSGKRPAQYTSGSMGVNYSVFGNIGVSTNGQVNFRPSAAVAAGASFRWSITFLLP